MKPIALITGASSGIGRNLALVAAREGYDLILVARRQDRLEEVAKECCQQFGAESQIIPVDLSRQSDWNEVAEALKASKDRLEVVVNNAGFGGAGRVVDLEWERQHDMIIVNVSALAFLSRHSAALMEKRGKGYIMNVASTAAFFPGPLMAVYYASKAFVLHFSEALAREMSGTGVVVTTLCPGPTESEFLEASRMKRPIYFRGYIPTSAQVADWGWKSMMRGRVVAVHTFKNFLLTQMVRIAPRWVLRRITYLLNGTK